MSLHASSFARYLVTSLCAGLLFAMGGAATASEPAWLPAGDPATREALERLVDQRVINVTLMAWPMPAGDLRRELTHARAKGLLTDAQLASIDVLETALQGRRSWHVAAAEPQELRTFANTPRENGEVGVQLDWSRGDRMSASLQVAVVTGSDDAQSLRPDGSYATVRTGNWLWTAGWQERWWGPGYDGSLLLSNNARPVFAVSLDRATSRPFETRLLHWLGPWTFGTFMGKLEANRPDVDSALLWGMRAAIRPLRGFEIGVTRSAQWCGDGRPCGLNTFWDVLTGRDNQGLNVDPDKEPGNQLASLDYRWGGHIGRMPLSIYWQHTGEDFDQSIPRPLKAMNVAGLSTWGDTAGGVRWRAHVEYATTICSDWDANREPVFNCGYENSIFTAGYRYRARALGHSIDGDSRQWSLGVTATTLNQWTLNAALRRAQINIGGSEPQVYHSVSPTPQEHWIAESSLSGRWHGSRVELGLGLARIEDDASSGSELDVTAYARWQRPF